MGIANILSQFARHAGASLVFLFVVLSIGACHPPDKPSNVDNTIPSPTPRTTPASAPTPKVTPNEPKSEVMRQNSNVSLGPAGQSELRVLGDNNWHPLRDHDRVLADSDGEAELNITDCMRVYVFRDSELVKAACSKSSYESGNVTCAAAGTSLFNNSCGDKVVIQTDSAEINLEGTYLSVTYLPANRLTLVMVLKGKVRLRPVTNSKERTLGEPTEVGEGNFWYSVPDDGTASLPGRNAPQRQAHPLGQMGALVTPLKLEPWLSKVIEQAGRDGIKVDRSSFISKESPTNPGQPTGSDTRIDCDCNNIAPGLLARPYQRQCKLAEQKLVEELRRTGRVTGKCDSVASGPRATPK